MKKKKKSNVQTKTFKTRIYLDDFSKQYCERAFGVRRWVWNWGLSQMLSTYAKTKEMPHNFVLDPIFREAVKAKADSGFAWIAEQLVSAKVMEECLKDLKVSFKVVPHIKKILINIMLRVSINLKDIAASAGGTKCNQNL